MSTPGFWKAEVLTWERRANEWRAEVAFVMQENAALRAENERLKKELEQACVDSSR